MLKLDHSICEVTPHSSGLVTAHFETDCVNWADFETIQAASDDGPVTAYFTKRLKPVGVDADGTIRPATLLVRPAERETAERIPAATNKPAKRIDADGFVVEEE